jgi:hypothetical protein
MKSLKLIKTCENFITRNQDTRGETHKQNGTCSSTSLDVVSGGHPVRFRIDFFHKISGSGPSRYTESILPVLYENFQNFKSIQYQDQVGIEVLKRTQY